MSQVLHPSREMNAEALKIRQREQKDADARKYMDSDSSSAKYTSEKEHVLIYKSSELCRRDSDRQSSVFGHHKP